MSLWLSIGLLAASALSQGGLVGSRSLLDLDQSSDLIVVGTASADIVVGAKVVNFDMRVDRVVKGDPAIAGKIIPVSWTSESGFLTGMIAPTGARVAENGTGLWFLQRLPSGWTLLPVLTGNSVSLNDVFVPAPPGPIASAYQYGPAAPLSDKAASELAAAMEANNAHSLQLSMMESSLDELKSQVTQIFYQRMSTSASTGHRILGLSGLIRSGSATALESASRASKDFEGIIGYSTVLNGISGEFRATDASSIAVLGRIALDSTNPSREFREAAAHALASIHSRTALPYLAALLDDPDAKLRIEAIGGLGSFANGTPMQTTADTPSRASMQLTGDGTYRTPETMQNFVRGEQAIERNEGAYLAFWKSWWASNRTSLGY